MLRLITRTIDNLVDGLKALKSSDNTVSLSTKVKHLFSDVYRLSERDVERLLEDWELQLLESDVSLELAEHLRSVLKERLMNTPIRKGKEKEDVKAVVKDALLSALKKPRSLEMLLEGKGKKPVVVFFIGPNGAGKTTTIAKVGKWLRDRKLNVLLVGADTFRAAADEQLTEHAKRLSLPIIVGERGEKSFNVVLRALSFAKKRFYDIVLVDTAGRQETSVELMMELKKLYEKVKPDVSVFVGESIGGHALLSHLEELKKFVEVDGVVLTKKDIDSKGGTVLSVLFAGYDVVMLTMGEGYDDWEACDVKKVVDELVGD
jgi:fused signal recognition particle receptor